MDETTTRMALGDHFGEPVQRYEMDDTATMIHFVDGGARIVETRVVNRLVEEWKESHKGNASA